MNKRTVITPDVSELEKAPNKGRTILFETVYGSKLYGCDMPTSDHDIRGVYLPGLYDFLREVKPEASALTPHGDLGESDDVMYFPTGLFIDQVLRMKSNCTEIFLAALQARAEGQSFHPAMEIILDAKDDLLSADPIGFIGHARQRAAKYIEGDDARDKTLQANKHTLSCLQDAAARSHAAPGIQIQEVEGLVDAITNHPSVNLEPNGEGEVVIYVAARQLQLNTRIAEAIKTTEGRLQRFRKKRLDAEPEKMFKDLCTSLRMMETATELMKNGTISFPLPRANYYRSIRRGEIDRQSIVDQINDAQNLAEDIVAQGMSPLRPKYESGESAPVRDALVARVLYLAIKDIPL